MREADRRPVTIAWEPLAILGSIIVIWQAAAARGLIDVLFFPPPSDWLVALSALAADGTLATDAGATLRRLLVGIGMGAMAAIATGLVVGRTPRAYRALNPFVTFLHPLPKIAVFPLLLLLLGLGDRPKVAVIAIAAFFPLFVTTVLGVRQIEPAYLEVARSVRASRTLSLRRVTVPGSLPAIISGLRLSFNSALTSAIALEFVSAGEGLGARIWLSWQSLRTDQLFAVLAVVSTLGFLSNWLLQRLLRRLAPWSPAA